MVMGCGAGYGTTRTGSGCSRRILQEPHLAGLSEAYRDLRRWNEIGVYVASGGSGKLPAEVRATRWLARQLGET
jgi:hypothetical protein